MNPERIENMYVTSKHHRGEFVLYWMQQSQRIQYNHALLYAIEKANEKKLPLVVYFGLTDEFPEANERHFTFMLQGITELGKDLEDLGITFFLQKQSPEKGIRKILLKADALVMDKGYLRIQKKWREEVALEAMSRDITVTCVESDVVVPLHLVSQKAEYAARTIRPKIKKQLEFFLENVHLPEIKNKTYVNEFSDISNRIEKLSVESILQKLDLDKSVRASIRFYGGERAAKEQFMQFLEEHFDQYLDSNSPANDFCSHLSPYLHFGQISPVWITKKVLEEVSKNESLEANAQAFLEQLIVRRELAMNFVYYTADYDIYEHMTENWAYKTMDAHLCDKRDYLYSLKDLELGRTHDIYWNVAMYEMVQTGYMHNYMRMYWAKKILEWSKTPKEAYETIKYLNNRYFLDGRDANSFAGIAWCFGKHDRAWTNRDIFGSLRYMNQAGLIRKFDMDMYVKRVMRMPGFYEKNTLDFFIHKTDFV